MTRSRWIFPVVLIPVALAVAWALRATWHPAPHPGGDNAGYVALAHALGSGQGYTELWDPARPPHTKYPPVFAASLAVARSLGATTWGGLKTVPVLFGVLALAATFLWAHRRRGLLWGALAALLTGLSATFLYHSHYLLSDVPFLAFTMATLWLVGERRGDPWGCDWGPGPATPPADEDPDAPGLSRAAVAGALVCAGLAYFTRSAGLPLVVALLGLLVVRKHLAAAVVGAVALAVPAGVWLLRARNTVADGAYVREFWMVDPYRPDLGEIGLGGLVPRAFENAVGYLTTHLPLALTGNGDAIALPGLVVGVLAVVGWAVAARSRVGAAELFVPLYVAVILVWPVVWSGDRFALPLVPLAVVYGGEALAWGVSRLRRDVAVPALVVGVAVLGLTQMAGVARAADESAACRGAARAGGPWACSGVGMVQFTEAARWAGANLPDDAVVLTRKPRIWYAMSGRATRTYPFVPYPDSVLAVARRAGASYVLLDLVGAQAQLLANAVAARPGAFCSVASFGGADGGPRTELLGILPEEGAEAPAPGEEVRIVSCPDALRGRGVGVAPYSSSSTIPILMSSPSP